MHAGAGPYALLVPLALVVDRCAALPAHAPRAQVAANRCVTRAGKHAQ